MLLMIIIIFIMICMNSSGRLSYNDFKQALTNQHKSANVVNKLICWWYATIWIWIFLGKTHGWAVFPQGLSGTFPCQAIEVIKAAYKLESTLPHGPRVVGVEGLDELLSKIAKDEQVWWFKRYVPTFGKEDVIGGQKRTKLQIKLQYFVSKLFVWLGIIPSFPAKDLQGIPWINGLYHKLPESIQQYLLFALASLYP